MQSKVIGDTLNGTIKCSITADSQNLCSVIVARRSEGWIKDYIISVGENRVVIKHKN